MQTQEQVLQQQMQRQEQNPTSVSPMADKPRSVAPQQWLMDRIRGQSKYNDRERPPGPCCWVSPFVGWCPSLLETNCLCRAFGRMGISQNELFRFLCLHLGFIANLLAMIATSYACLSISFEYFLLSKASMEVMEAKVIGGEGFSGSSKAITVYLGLRGVGFDHPEVSGNPVIGYDDLCEIAASDADFTIDPTKECGSCSSDYFSMNAVISLLVAVSLFFPTFFSQQLRMYSGYDVNCVKNFLSVIGFCIVLLNLNVMLTYFYLCSKESFFEEPTVKFDRDGTVLDPDAENFLYEMQYTWTWGWGLVSLIAGTGLKVFDLLCNISVPTPKVTRDRREQEIYETIMYVDPEDDEGATDDEKYQ